MLLIHGLLVTREMFHPVLDAYARRHRVILPDLRGHGRSAGLPGPYTIEQHAADLARLLDHLKVPTVDVLGYSLGGAIAQQLALDFPEKVHTLTLACTFASRTMRLRERIEAIALPWAIRLLGSDNYVTLRIRSGITQTPLTSEQEQRLRRMMAANTKVRVLQVVQGMSAFDSRPWLPRIASPTLVIAGARDATVPPEHARILAREIPRAELALVDGANHYLIRTHPEALISLTEAFWGQHPESDDRLEPPQRFSHNI